jgi:hypothetical protein
MRYALPLFALTVLAACAVDNTVKTDASDAGKTEGTMTAAPAAMGTSRTFEFTYNTAVDVTADNATVDIWLPIPQSSDVQTVEVLSMSEGLTAVDDTNYGNKIAYGHWEGVKAGKLELSMKFKISRKEWTTNFRGVGATVISADAQGKFARDLGSNRTINLESELVNGAFADVQKLWEGCPPGIADFPAHTGNTVRQARRIYDYVLDSMWYEKRPDTAWGNGDADWACDSRYGNCTDFHSLFLALCRKSGIPARFEMGFSIPGARSFDADAKVPGYHCWAMFYCEGTGWIPVDISEADKHPHMSEYYFGALTEDRFTATVGRDLTPPTLPAGQKEFGSINFLVYPVCDINGENAGGAVSKSFAYRDVK